MKTLTPIDENTPVGEIAAKDFRNAELFIRYGIDFCCGGKKSILAACTEKGLETSGILKEISGIAVEPAPVVPDFNEMDLDKLADHIVWVHHSYVIKSMPQIFEYATKVSRVHGKNHPEVNDILNNFINIMNELNSHMMKEENILFPYIRRLAEGKRSNTPVTPPPFGSIRHPIQMMEFEHDIAGNLLGKIGELTGQYTPPADACNTFRLLYGKLAEFDKDLKQHIHLENNILFPKSILLEEQISGNA